MNRIYLRKLLLFALISFALCIIFAATYIAIDRSFDVFVDIPQRVATKNQATNVKIGIIGDSWVSGHQLDRPVLDTILISGIQAKIVSVGHPGAKSRQVYRDLVSEEFTQFSSRHILMDEDIDYLVVVAGVNDTAGHIGSDFYVHHMKCIIRAAQIRGIHPVIVEVPEYGIEITPSMGFLSYVKRLIYQTIFDGMQQNVIPAYRNAFKQNLTPEMLAGMSIVSFSQIAKDYCENIELYANPSHLNNNGNQELGKLIGQTIIDSCRNRSKK